jgi:transposase
MGISSAAVYKWTKRYRAQGEEGLRFQYRRSSGARRLAEPVRQKILELKKEEPSRGIKRISQLLRRVLFLPASAETVRQTLKREGLIEPPPKPRRNLVRPRFFERASVRDGNLPRQSLRPTHSTSLPRTPPPRQAYYRR